MLHPSEHPISYGYGRAAVNCSKLDACIMYIHITQLQYWAVFFFLI